MPQTAAPRTGGTVQRMMTSSTSNQGPSSSGTGAPAVTFATLNPPPSPRFLDQLAALETLTFGDIATSRDDFEEYLKLPQARMYIAMLPDESPVGYILVFELDDKLGIESIGVHPDYRGRGLATTLIQGAITRSRHSKAELQVEKANQKAISLYQTLGFKAIAEITDDYGRPAYQMRRTG